MIFRYGQLICSMTEVEEEEEEASQQGTHHSFGDGGMEILPCGQNDLKVV